MDEDQIKSKLREVLQSFNRYGEPISDTTKLEDDLGIDSLGILILIAELETAFEITIDAEKERTRDNFGTVGEMRRFIIRKLKHNINGNK